MNVLYKRTVRQVGHLPEVISRWTVSKMYNFGLHKLTSLGQFNLRNWTEYRMEIVAFFMTCFWKQMKLNLIHFLLTSTAPHIKTSSKKICQRRRVEQNLSYHT